MFGSLQLESATISGAEGCRHAVTWENSSVFSSKPRTFQREGFGIEPPSSLRTLLGFGGGVTSPARAVEIEDRPYPGYRGGQVGEAQIAATE